MAFPPLDAPSVGSTAVVAAVVVLSGLVSVALATVGILAFRRRRSPAYLLIATALVVLALKAVVGGLTISGVLGIGPHHLIEHGLDLLMAILLIGAIYVARSQHRCRLNALTSDGPLS